MEMCQGNGNPQLDQGCENKIRVWKEIRLEEQFFAENCAGALRGWAECYFHCFWSVESGFDGNIERASSGFSAGGATWPRVVLLPRQSRLCLPDVYQMWAMLSLAQGFHREDQGLPG